LNEWTDKQLVEQSQSGDQAAYAVLVKRHSRPLFLACLGRLGNVHDAEDVTQETLIRGYTQITTLKDPDKFIQWLLRIGRNGCTDILRKRVLQNQHATERLECRPTDTKPDDRLGTLRQALARLPEQYRAILQLHYFDGHKTKELAAFLKISHQGARTRLFRARRKLADILAECGGVL